MNSEFIHHVLNIGGGAGFGKEGNIAPCFSGSVVFLLFSGLSGKKPNFTRSCLRGPVLLTLCCQRKLHREGGAQSSCLSHTFDLGAFEHLQPWSFIKRESIALLRMTADQLSGLPRPVRVFLLGSEFTKSHTAHLFLLVSKHGPSCQPVQ